MGVIYTPYPFIVEGGKRNWALWSYCLPVTAGAIRDSFLCEDAEGNRTARSDVSTTFTLEHESVLCCVVRADDPDGFLYNEGLRWLAKTDRVGVWGETLEALVDSAAMRYLQAVGELPADVRELCDDLALWAEWVRAQADSGGLDNFGEWQRWALTLTESPGTTMTFPPGIFVSVRDTFAERATRMVGLDAQLNALPPDHFANVVLLLAEMETLRLLLGSLTAAGFNGSGDGF